MGFGSVKVHQSSQLLPPLWLHESAAAVPQYPQQPVLIVELERPLHALRSIGAVAHGRHSRAGLEHQLQDPAGGKDSRKLRDRGGFGGHGGQVLYHRIAQDEIERPRLKGQRFLQVGDPEPVRRFPGAVPSPG